MTLNKITIVTILLKLLMLSQLVQHTTIKV